MAMLVVETVDDLSIVQRDDHTSAYVNDTGRGGMFTYTPSHKILVVDNKAIFKAEDGGYWVRMFLVVA